MNEETKKYDRLVQLLEEVRESDDDDSLTLGAQSEGWDKNGKYYSTYQALGDILHHMMKYRNQIKQCDKIINELKDELYKDHELSRMREYVDKVKADLHRGFGITEKEEAAIAEWEMNHCIEKHPSTVEKPWSDGAVGGRFSYRFVPTSIGVIGEVECSCGEKFCFRKLT